MLSNLCARHKMFCHRNNNYQVQSSIFLFNSKSFMPLKFTFEKNKKGKMYEEFNFFGNFVSTFFTCIISQNCQHLMRLLLQLQRASPTHRPKLYTRQIYQVLVRFIQVTLRSRIISSYLVFIQLVQCVYIILITSYLAQSVHTAVHAYIT